MNPQPVTTDQWEQISRALIYLFLFTGFGLTSAMAFLFGRAVLPSLVASRDIHLTVGLLRWVAYPISAAALLLASYALLRGLQIGTQVALQIYPRAWI